MTAGIGIAGLPLADSPLGRTVARTATDIWNDSCAIDELEYALSFGAVGATANPTIVVDVWNKDPGHLAAAGRGACPRTPRRERVRPRLGRGRGHVDQRGAAARARVRGPGRAAGPSLGADQPDAVPVGSADGRPGRPVLGHRAQHHREVAGHGRGDRAIEEATYRGVSVNVTVSFTVAQAVAAADAIERGLRRRDAEGLRHAAHGSRGHAHDGSSRGLAARRRRSRRPHDRSRRTAVERRCGLQAGLRRVPGREASGRACWARRSGTTTTGRSSSGETS